MREEQHHETEQEAKESFLASFEEATSDGNPWMAVAWSLEGDRITVRKTSMAYPKRDYLPSLMQLKGILDREIAEMFANQPPPTPLPKADILSRIPKFGPSAEEVEKTIHKLNEGVKRNGAK